LVLSLEPTKQDLLEESILYGVVDTFFVDVKTNVTSVLVFVNNSQNCSVCKPSELDNSIGVISTEQKSCTYYLLSSPEFSGDSLSSCLSLNKQYSLGYIERQEVLSNRTLYERRDEYYNNYNNSKTRFGVPEVVDFAVIIEGTDFSMERTIPDEAGVISGVYRKRVIYANGSIINRDFIVKVW
jgi:hypothetical protein